MGTLESSVVTIVDGWQVEEHAYDGAPFATADELGRWGMVTDHSTSAEFSGDQIIVVVEAPYEGSNNVHIPWSVIQALVTIHNRRSSSDNG